MRVINISDSSSSSASKAPTKNKKGEKAVMPSTTDSKLPRWNLKDLKVSPFTIVMVSLIVAALVFRFIALPRLNGTATTGSEGNTVKQYNTEFSCIASDDSTLEIDHLEVREKGGNFEQVADTRSFKDLKNLNSVTGVSSYKVQRIPALIQASQNKDFLGRQTPFVGNLLYLVNADGLTDGTDLVTAQDKEQVGSKFVLDMSISNSGTDLYLLEAEPVSSVKSNPRTCFNCAEVEFNLLFTTYRYNGEDLTFVSDTLLTTASLLVDNVRSVKVEDTAQIRIEKGNLYSRGSDGEVLDLRGNDLMGWSMEVSPTGQKVILVKDGKGYYPSEDAGITEIDDFDPNAGFKFLSDDLMWRKQAADSKVELMDVRSGDVTELDGSEAIVAVLPLADKLFTLSKSSEGTAENPKYDLRVATQYLAATDKPPIATLSESDFKGLAYSADGSQMIMVSGRCTASIVTLPK